VHWLITRALPNKLALVLQLSIAFIVPSLHAQTPSGRADSDFVVAGIAPYMHRDAVERILGRPDSVSVGFHPDLYYPGLTVSFADLGVWLMTLRTPRYQTARGLRVGESLARARRLYGSSDVLAGEYWYCGAESALDPDQGIALVVAGARITSIKVGVICRRD